MVIGIFEDVIIVMILNNVTIVFELLVLGHVSFLILHRLSTYIIALIYNSSGKIHKRTSVILTHDRKLSSLATTPPMFK